VDVVDLGKQVEARHHRPALIYQPQPRAHASSSSLLHSPLLSGGWGGRSVISPSIIRGGGCTPYLPKNGKCTSDLDRLIILLVSIAVASGTLTPQP
jgi:hypothetical protein